DVWPPLDSRIVGGMPIVDGDALETGAFQHALDQTQDLVVVIDHQRDVAVDQGGLRSVRRRVDSPCDGHVACWPVRGSFSVSRIARSAAALTSWMSARIASGSFSSSPMSSL